jgi:hypothetical protein
MTSDNVKSLAIVLVVGTGAFLVYRAFSNAAQGAASAADGVKSLITGLTNQVNTLKNSAGSVIDAATTTLSDAIDNGKRALGQDVPVTSATNSEFKPSAYVTELPFSRWPQSAIDGINALNRTRGISRTWKYAGDFAGWHVYSNGTVISPDGYYLRDLIAAGDVSSSSASFAINEIPNSFTGLTFDQTRYQWQEAQDA